MGRPRKDKGVGTEAVGETVETVETPVEAPVESVVEAPVEPEPTVIEPISEVSAYIGKKLGGKKIISAYELPNGRVQLYDEAGAGYTNERPYFNENIA